MPGARLTEHDRGVIERAMGQGLSVPQIAALVGKHRTTVARELTQGSGSRPDRRPKHPAGSARRGTRGRAAVYHAWVAQTRATESARRPKEFKLSGDLGLVVSGLGVLAIAWIAVRDRTREIGTRRALGRLEGAETDQRNRLTLRHCLDDGGDNRRQRLVGSSLCDTSLLCSNLDQLGLIHLSASC